ncbi:MAG: TIGR02611 family protein [Streptosporangiales bacterium]|nr:TIGR02611 family protein [Streptosporangiales bacterium]
MLNTTWRLLVLTVGCLVLLGGLVMMIGPGPGIVAVILGLAILATEFAWAQRLLHRAKVTAERAKDKALDPRKRRRNQILLVVAVAVAAAAIIAYLWIYGLTLPWELLNRP